MAQLLSHPCSTQGCRGTAKHAKYCDSCKESGIVERPSSTQRGYDRHWQAYRNTFLYQNRFCADPFGTHKADGTVVGATLVDHIIPHSGNQELFWRESNHQALCKSCHDRKTAEFDGGFGNKPRSVKQFLSLKVGKINEGAEWGGG